MQTNGRRESEQLNVPMRENVPYTKLNAQLVAV